MVNICRTILYSVLVFLIVYITLINSKHKCSNTILVKLILRISFLTLRFFGDSQYIICKLLYRMRKIERISQLDDENRALREDKEQLRGEKEQFRQVQKNLKAVRNIYKL